MNSEWFSDSSMWLPIVFIGLMGLAILVYAILDGYDLGVGMLMPMEKEEEAYRDTMIASIGPFWDANETWLVLAVGLLLIAFPSAHSLILFELYLPATLMLVGLILRGVAFDFRAKAGVDHKYLWDCTFKLGSWLTALCQGFMLGQYVTGFQNSTATLIFSLISAIGVAAAYCFIGSAWLVMKTEQALQSKAIYWARTLGRISFIWIVIVCGVNLWINPDVFARWFEFPLVMFVLLVPTLCLILFMLNDVALERIAKTAERYSWVPFILVSGIFTLCFSGLAFSFFPYIVPGQMDIWQASSAPESLMFILVGASVVIPCILVYTAFSYRVFRGKTTELKYD